MIASSSGQGAARINIMVCISMTMDLVSMTYVRHRVSELRSVICVPIKYTYAILSRVLHCYEERSSLESSKRFQ